ncbi:hypothetical protein L6R52_43260 [Myxococcota bacterium]|nr:hypothetical protein [Myxococcota bacterium]
MGHVIAATRTRAGRACAILEQRVNPEGGVRNERAYLRRQSFANYLLLRAPTRPRTSSVSVSRGRTSCRGPSAPRRAASRERATLTTSRSQRTSSGSTTRAALEAGADAIGLLRSELLLHDRDTAPSEDEQAQSCRAIAARSPRT